MVQRRTFTNRLARAFTVLAVSAATPAYAAVPLPAFDPGNCVGDQKCVDEVRNGDYMALAVSWNNLNDEDKAFCVEHENYSSHYLQFHYKMLLDCLYIRDFQRNGIN